MSRLIPSTTKKMGMKNPYPKLWSFSWVFDALPGEEPLRDLWHDKNDEEDEEECSCKEANELVHAGILLDLEQDREQEKARGVHDDDGRNEKFRELFP